MEDVSDTDVFAALSESPPKEEKRARTRRGEPRSSSVKRASSHPPALPPSAPRRGRSRPRDLIHEEVQVNQTSVQSAVMSIQEQLREDRAHMADLRGAIQKVYDEVAEKSFKLQNLETRADEQTRLRFDDHREHVRQLRQIPTDVDTRMNVIQKGLEDEFIRLRSAVRPGVEGLVTSHMDTIVNDAIELKAAEINKNLENMQRIIAEHGQREDAMGQYLSELQQERPEEGKTIVTAFKVLQGEVDKLRFYQAQQATATAGLSTATAAGLNSVAAGVGSADEMQAIRQQVEALVTAQQAQPCHCGT